MPSTITIYLCSDRDDLRAEREYLHATIIPEFQTWAAGIGKRVEILDPHRDALALPDALAALERCRPRVLALVGTRYGDHLADNDTAQLARDPGLRPLLRDGVSRLHVELHAAFAPVPSPQRAIAVLQRDLSFLEQLPDGDARDHRPGSPAELADLADLLDQIRTWGTPVEYPCTWNTTSQTIESLQEFGRAALELLKRIARWPTAAPASFAPAPAPAPASFAPAPAPAPASFAPAPAVEVDENVQFTVYRPKVVPPAKWQDLLAFAHLSEKPPDAPADEPDPVEEVKRQAKQVLGDKAVAYQSSTQDSLHGVPKRGEITFLPEMNGIEFNPPRRTFTWQETVHREDFRFRADATLVGTTARGKLSIFHGAILLGDVPLAIKIDASPPAPKPRALLDTPEMTDLEPVTATRYRKIFASYSHKDLAIVEQFEAYAEAMGDQYLRDWKHLRAGERWHDKLMKMIREADVFQLFWSRHSMLSPFVRQEWEYALSLTQKGESFVRPTYWEDPMPTSSAPPLPPPDLAELHFQRLSVPGTATVGSPHAPRLDADMFSVASDSQFHHSVEAAAPPPAAGDESDLELSDEESVAEDMFSSATESDFVFPVDADSQEVAQLDDSVAAEDSDDATFDESSEMMVIDVDDSSSMAGLDLSVPRSAPLGSAARPMPEVFEEDAEPPVRSKPSRARRRFDDDDDSPPMMSARPAPRAGSSETLKIILGVLALCVALVVLLILVTGRIPFVK